ASMPVHLYDLPITGVETALDDSESDGAITRISHAPEGISSVKYVVAGFSPRYRRARMQHSANPERGLKPATTYSARLSPTLAEIVRFRPVGSLPPTPSGSRLANLLLGHAA